jgi:hypothetical protein
MKYRLQITLASPVISPYLLTEKILVKQVNKKRIDREFGSREGKEG